MTLLGICSDIAYFVSRFSFEIILRLFFDLKVIGKKNVPAKGPFIIAANHVSYMDPPILGSVTNKRLYFITADYLYKNRLLGWWYKSVGCVKVRRGRPDHTALRRIFSLLRAGKSIAVFPEGARSDDGKTGEPLAGIGFIALKSKAPVIPCLIKGSEKALPKGAKSFKRSKVSIIVGGPIKSEDFDCGENKKEAYRLFSNKVMNNIAHLDKSYEN